MKKISILGSTGSIGTQTLDIVRDNKDIRVLALCAGSNIDLLEKQIWEFRPQLAAVYDEKKALELKKRMKAPGKAVDGKRAPRTEILSGMDGLMAASTLKGVDIVVTALVGMIGIKPTIAAIKSGKDIALSNKETLVTAGHIIMPLAARKHVSILPVDSEHSAVFQALNGESIKEVDKLLLTASGGPFLGKTLPDLRNIRPEDALKHPNWSMGNKVTIDSSTLVNKGLEVMEAGWLFGIPTERIQVVVHPQSIIHSMVQFCDGSVIAQMGVPDMHLPIQYALYYPHRHLSGGSRLDFSKLRSLTFAKPDTETFRGLKLGLDAASIGGSMPTVYNAANERAVSMFLNNEIMYLDIIRIIEKCMEGHHVINNPSVDEILQVESDIHKRISDGIL